MMVDQLSRYRASTPGAAGRSRRPIIAARIPPLRPARRSPRGTDMGKFDLSGRSALVMGGAHGMGAGTAAVLTEAGRG
jgi:hypothetical protein